MLRCFCVSAAEVATWVSGAGPADTPQLLGLLTGLLRVLSLWPSDARHCYSHGSAQFTYLFRGYVWNKIISKLYRPSSTSDGNNFILVHGNCLKLFQNYFTGLLQLANIFQRIHCCQN